MPKLIQAVSNSTNAERSHRLSKAVAGSTEASRLLARKIATNNATAGSALAPGRSRSTRYEAVTITTQRRNTSALFLVARNGGMARTNRAFIRDAGGATSRRSGCRAARRRTHADGSQALARALVEQPDTRQV